MNYTFFLSLTYTYQKSFQELFYEFLENAQKWFPELYVINRDQSEDIEQIRNNGFLYIARVNKKENYSYLEGTIEHIDNTDDKLEFKLKLEKSSEHKTWVRLTMDLYEPQTIKKYKWWLSPFGVLTFSELLNDKLTNMPDVYAATFNDTTQHITASLANQISEKTSSVITSIQHIIANPSVTTAVVSQKPAIAAVFAAVIAMNAVGISIDDTPQDGPITVFEDSALGMDDTPTVPKDDVSGQPAIPIKNTPESFAGPPSITSTADVSSITPTVDDTPVPSDDVPDDIIPDDVTPPDPTPIVDTADDITPPTPSNSDIIPVGDSPANLAMDATNKMSYVIQSNDDTVSVIDTETDTVTGTIEVGIAPRGIAIDTNQDKVYVLNRNSEQTSGGVSEIGTVSVIDTYTNAVTDTISVGKNPLEIAIDTTNSRAYVANDDSNDVSVIDTETDTVIDTIPVGTGPKGIAIDTVHDKVYVPNYQQGTVSVIDADTNAVDTVVVEEEPYRVAIDTVQNKAYVTHYDKYIERPGIVSVLGTNTNTLIDTITIGDKLRGIAIDVDTSRAYVVSAGTNDVSVIDTTNDMVLGTIPVGNSPYGITLVDEKTAYVSNVADDTLSVIDLTKYNPIANYYIDSLPESDWKPYSIVYSPLQKGQDQSVVQIPPKNIHTDIAGLSKFTNTIKVYYPGPLTPMVNSAAEVGIQVDIHVILDSDAQSSNELVYDLFHEISQIPDNQQHTISSIIFDLSKPDHETDKDGVPTYDFGPLSDAIEYAKDSTDRSVGVTAPYVSLMFNKQLHSAINDADYIIVFHYPEKQQDLKEFSQWYPQYIPDYNEIISNKYASHDVYFEVAAPSGDGGGISGIDEMEQAEFYENIRGMSEKKNIPVYIFEAFDEPWKRNYGDNEHWGLFNENRTLKPELLEVFYDNPHVMDAAIPVQDSDVVAPVDANVSDGTSMQDSITDDVDSEPKAILPVAKIDIMTDGPYQRGDTVTFSAGSSYHPEISEEIDVYSWNFGDNTTEMGKTAEKTFRATGEYEVTLKVYDKDGNQGMDTVTVRIDDLVLHQTHL